MKQGKGRKHVAFGLLSQQTEKEENGERITADTDSVSIIREKLEHSFYKYVQILSRVGAK